MYEKFKEQKSYALLDTSKYPPEVAGRFNSFIVTQFDDSLSVEMQMRSIIKWAIDNFKEMDQTYNNFTEYIIQGNLNPFIEFLNDLIAYMNEFIETFDEKYQETILDKMQEWYDNGELETLINESLDTKYHEMDNRLTTQLAHYGKVLGERLPNETDDTGRVQRLIDSLGSGEHGLIPPKEDGSDYRFTGVHLKPNIHLTIRGNFVLTGEGNTAFSLAGCTYTILDGEFHVELKQKNQIGFYIGKDEEGKPSQLNTLNNASVEGEYIEGTTAVVIDYAWINRFYNCHWFRSENGLLIQGQANANNFFGCEIRSDRSVGQSGYAMMLDGGGDGNVWFGGAVENHYGGIVNKKGQFSFLGTWIEGIGRPTERGVLLEDGSLTIKDSYFQAYIEIKGGRQFIFEGNTVASNYTADVLNISFPLIAYTADVETKLSTKDNLLAEGAYLTRYGKYNSGSGYIDRSSGNLNEVSGENRTHVIAKRTNIITQPPGIYLITFNETFLDELGEWETNQTFRPKNDGYYKLSLYVKVKGFPSGVAGRLRLIETYGGTDTVFMEIGAGARDYNDLVTLSGTTIVKMSANSPVQFKYTAGVGTSDPDDLTLQSAELVIERYK